MLYRSHTPHSSPLIFETPSGEVDKFSHSLRQVMCSVAKLSVPLEVEIGFGENWEQAH